MSSNAIVIGDGANELVCAHYLARAGLRVTLLRRGSGAVDAAVAGWVAPRIIDDLGLAGRGLRIDIPDPWMTTRMPDGERLELWHDPLRTAASIRRYSYRDAEQWPAFCARMARLARFMETLYLQAPPNLLLQGRAELMRHARLGWAARALGREGIEDLLRVLPMSVADLLDDCFENDALKGALAVSGIAHLQQGPRSGGTASVMLHHHVGCPEGVFRPPRSNLHEVLRSMPGVELRHADVSEIKVREGRAVGVVLADGGELPAPVVVSGLDPRRTLLQWLDAGWLDPEIARAMRNVRSRGVVALARLKLARPPAIRSWLVAPSLDYLEHAYDESKYGRMSRRPYLEAACSAASPEGVCAADIHVQFAPFTLKGREWDTDARRELSRNVTDILQQHVPEWVATVTDQRLLAPPDLETELGWTQGQAYQAELALDQALWMRPTPEWSRYRMPVDGVYLCGAATHPGSLSGVCGFNAAQEIMRTLKR